MQLTKIKSRVLAEYKDSTFDVRKVLHPRENSNYSENKAVDMYKIKAAISRILEPKKIFEIGIRYGYSAAALLWCNSEASYTGLDWFQRGNNFSLTSTEQYQLLSLMLKSWYPQAEISVNMGDSFVESVQNNWCERLGDQIDLVNVDGDHSFDGCLNDLLFAGKLVKDGGYLLVDDYTNPKYSDDIKKAISEFSNKYDTELVVFPSWRGDALIQVFKESS